VKAYLKQVRISPKKVNVVASLVRGKPVKEALTMLKFTPKRSAPILATLIASAAANAENNFKQDADKLFISKLIVNEGQTLKRGLPVSKGRWHPILKRSARITVELSPMEAKPEEKKVKKTKKAEEVKPEAKAEKKEEIKAEAKVEKAEEKKVETPIEVKPEVKKEEKPAEKVEEKKEEVKVEEKKEDSKEENPKA
jgi:large subunit ribosomal protein L22